MKNWILGKIAGCIGGKLDGYKTKIGAVLIFLYGAISLVAKLFPDQNLPGADVPISDAITSMSDALNALGIFGAAMAASGVTHKAVKQQSSSGMSLTELEQRTQQMSQDITPGPPAGSAGFGPGTN